MDSVETYLKRIHDTVKDVPKDVDKEEEALLEGLFDMVATIVNETQKKIYEHRKNA